MASDFESWRDAGNGFTFANYAGGDMLYVLREAVYLYRDYPDAFARLRQRAMTCDFSWGRSAREYLRIYAGITGKVWAHPDAAAEADGQEHTAKRQPAGKKAPKQPAAAKKAAGRAAAGAVKKTSEKQKNTPKNGTAAGAKKRNTAE